MRCWPSHRRNEGDALGLRSCLEHGQVGSFPAPCASCAAARDPIHIKAAAALHSSATVQLEICSQSRCARGCSSSCHAIAVTSACCDNSEEPQLLQRPARAHAVRATAKRAAPAAPLSWHALVRRAVLRVPCYAGALLLYAHRGPLKDDPTLEGRVCRPSSTTMLLPILQLPRRLACARESLQSLWQTPGGANTPA